jgi:hypothetical protein
VCLLSSDLTMYLSAKFDLLQKKLPRVRVRPRPVLGPPPDPSEMMH